MKPFVSINVAAEATGGVEISTVEADIESINKIAIIMLTNLFFTIFTFFLLLMHFFNFFHFFLN